MKKIGVIIPAGGSSARAGGRDKLTVELGGVSVLERTVLAVDGAAEEATIAVAVSERLLPFAERIVNGRRWKNGPPVLCPGGDSRAQSVLNAFSAVRGAEVIAVHDGARPFVGAEDFRRVLAAAQTHGAAFLCAGAKETLHTAKGDFAVATVDRSTTVLAQTPQAFTAENFEKITAVMAASPERYTDEVSAAAELGIFPFCVRGGEGNVKLTTGHDLEAAEARFARGGFRIGHGYDVHRLEPGRRLVLGGVDIPFEKGLLGHSDADALSHAVIDAVLGAAALGDIGAHFPDSDGRYKGVSSLLLLEKTAELVGERGFAVVNVDAVVVLQAPRLAPHREQMAQNMARALGIPRECVNVKAKTEERLGFTGDGSGISAHAVALLQILG